VTKWEDELRNQGTKGRLAVQKSETGRDEVKNGGAEPDCEWKNERETVYGERREKKSKGDESKKFPLRAGRESLVTRGKDRAPSTLIGADDGFETVFAS
jgi:hypothetical protein